MMHLNEVERYTRLALNAVKNVKNQKAKITLEWLANSLTKRKK